MILQESIENIFIFFIKKQKQIKIRFKIQFNRNFSWKSTIQMNYFRNKHQNQLSTTKYENWNINTNTQRKRAKQAHQPFLSECFRQQLAWLFVVNWMAHERGLSILLIQFTGTFVYIQKIGTNETIEVTIKPSQKKKKTRSTVVRSTISGDSSAIFHTHTETDRPTHRKRDINEPNIA